jgi:hypothetical protein
MIPDQAFCNFRLSSTWPPLFHQELARITNKDHTIVIGVDTAGRMTFHYSDIDGEKEFIFQPIYPEVNGEYSGYTFTNNSPESHLEVSVKLYFKWGDHGVTLTCNDKEVLLQEDAQGSIFKAEARIRFAIGINKILQDIDNENVRNHEDYMFLETSKELEARLIKASRYDYIKSCGLIRQLLIDGDKSLALLISKKYGIKLVFSTTIAGSNKLMNLDTFLSNESFYNGKSSMTNRQVLLTYANVMGGVHLGKPLAKNPEQSSLIELDQRVIVNEKATSIETVRALCIIILNALYPMVESIRKANKY